jgi:hypothetical protein
MTGVWEPLEAHQRGIEPVRQILHLLDGIELTSEQPVASARKDIDRSIDHLRSSHG